MAKYKYKHAKYHLLAAPHRGGGWDIVCLREFDREHSEELVGHFATKKAAVEKLKKYVVKIENRLQGRWSAPWTIREIPSLDTANWYLESEHANVWPAPDRFVVTIDDWSKGPDIEQTLLFSYKA